MESLSGIIDKVTFHSEESGFTVLRVHAAGRRGPVTVVGTLPGAQVGEFVEAAGAWVNDRAHGLQFRADDLRTMPPHTPDGLAKYLGSGLVKGIGPHFAKKIVHAFGTETLHVLDNDPDRLAEVKGLGKKRIEAIRASWKEQKTVRDLLLFLRSHGVGTARALRIYKTYGEQALEIVRADPYRLAADVWGIGFRVADDLAANLGMDRNSPIRARAALRYVLQELTNDGHVGYPEEGVLQRTINLTSIDRAVVEAAVEEGRAQGELVREPGGEEAWLYLKPLFLAELGVARSLRHLRDARHPLPDLNLDVVLEWVQQKMGLELAPAQREAIRAAVTDKVLVITGGPGTGKTTIVRGILEILAVKKVPCALCAPTGRAAKRLAETTGREAKTIHRLLEYDPLMGGFRRDRANPIEAAFILVDETSMVDVVLMNQLLRAVPPQACLVLVGDVDQLPSVGPGNVLNDIIRSGAVPVARLTQIFRQAQDSHIVRAAHAVNEGERPESAPPGSGDFYFVAAETPDAVMEKIVTLIRERIPAKFGLDPVNEVQVLTPMNRYDLGARTLNDKLQEVLNPAKGGPEVERFGWKFRLGDKVIQTVNNYQKEVFNGDIGRVTEIDEQEQELLVTFDGRAVIYAFGELDELALAYALSIHKCVAGYGLAALQGHGLVPVQAVQPGQIIHTGLGSPKVVCDRWDAGDKAIVRVRTRRGYQIDVSAEHPLLVASTTLTPHFRLAGQLVPGWFACLNRHPIQGHAVPLPALTVGPTNGCGRNLKLPDQLTPDFAWFLGVLVGDGSYRNRRDGMVDVTSADTDLFVRFRTLAESWGLRVALRSQRSYQRAYFISKPFRQWLEHLGLGYVKSPEKRTPPRLFGATLAARAAYLQGLFDTDGHAGRNNVRYTTAALDLAHEVHALLLSLGIVASISSQGPRHHKVAVSGTAIRPFQELVGFSIWRKAQRLAGLVERTSSGKTNLDIIPFGQLLMEDYQQSIPHSQGRKGQGLFAHQVRDFQFVSNIRRGAFRTNYTHLTRLAHRAKAMNQRLPESLQRVLETNYYYDDIVAVEHLKTTTPMVDLEVADHHSFVVNGFVCHNSQGSEYPAVILPLHTQHAILLQRNLLYTGITRGKKLVVLVGQPKALAMAVRRQDTHQRFSALCRRLQEELGVAAEEDDDEPPEA